MATTRRELSFYATPGPMTDVGAYADMLDGLPANISELTHTVQGVLTHPSDEEVYGPDANAQTQDEVRTHGAAAMLARIGAHDNRPLVNARAEDHRLASICAHVATLLCATLRHQGKAARVRDGFASYLAPDMWTNHWITEYWDADRGVWARADADMPEKEWTARGLASNPADVTDDQFIPAGEAWRRCRTGEADPTNFGYPGFAGGLTYIAQQMVLDLAALNKVELLPEDRWDIAGKPEAQFLPDDVMLLDHVADLTARRDIDLGTIQEVYQGDERLRVPSVVYLHRGHGNEGEPITVPGGETA